MTRRYTPDNRFEIPDPVPVEKPLGWQAPESIESMIRRMVRGQVSQFAAAQGQETFEEANDFEVEDEEPLPFSPYELREGHFDGPPGFRKDASRARQEGPGGDEKDGSVPPQPEGPSGAPAGS